MPTIAGWSLLAIACVVAVVGGVLLLAAYALRRGVVRRELHGTIEAAADSQTMEEPPVAAPPAAGAGRTRNLGMAGALLLAIGLGLGLLGTVTGWGAPPSSEAGNPGQPPADCAQTWEGCPQATPATVP